MYLFIYDNVVFWKHLCFFEFICLGSLLTNCVVFQFHKDSEPQLPDLGNETH